MDEECVIIRNSRRFADYDGYAQSFEYKGPHVPTVPLAVNEIICIDAIDFSGFVNEQYLPHQILREINKAYVGFIKANPTIATGRMCA